MCSVTGGAGEQKVIADSKLEQLLLKMQFSQLRAEDKKNYINVQMTS
jgi:hypothetical protein